MGDGRVSERGARLKLKARVSNQKGGGLKKRVKNKADGVGGGETTSRGTSRTERPFIDTNESLYRKRKQKKKRNHTATTTLSGYNNNKNSAGDYMMRYFVFVFLLWGRGNNIWTTYF